MNNDKRLPIDTESASRKEQQMLTIQEQPHLISQFSKLNQHRPMQAQCIRHNLQQSKHSLSNKLQIQTEEKMSWTKGDNLSYRYLPQFEGELICSSQPRIYPQHPSEEEHKFGQLTKKAPRSNGIQKRKKKHRSRKTANKFQDQGIIRRFKESSGQEVGDATRFQVEHDIQVQSQGQARNQDFTRRRNIQFKRRHQRNGNKALTKILCRPMAPHNTTQFLSYDFNYCRTQSGNFPCSISFLEQTASNASQDLQEDQKQFHKDQFLNNSGSSPSTTAQERTYDEDTTFQSFEFIPGLSMEGLVDDQMFDLDFDADLEINPEQELSKTTQQSEDLESLSSEKLEMAILSNNLIISTLQKELVFKNIYINKLQ